MMDGNLLTLIVTVVLFLIGQLAGNIIVLAKLNTRITRVETHLIHLMKAENIHLWPKEQPPNYDENAS